jgi:NDP-sugar pyrophosphorylase family protein
MRALILAGGLGTRLRSLVSDRPKPMAEVEGRPFLEYLVLQLREQGFRELVFCVGHLAHHVRDYFGAGQPWGVSISYVVEVDLLGTAGAIRNAECWIDGPFLVMNGDSYLEADLRGLVTLHQRQGASDPRAVGTLLAVHVADASASGTVELEPDGRVIGFREKADRGAGWINGGVYVLQPKILEWIPVGRAASLEKEIFPALLEEGWHLYGQPERGFFVDIGTPEGYRRFQAYVLRSHREQEL